MNKKFKLASYAFCAFIAGALASCSSDGGYLNQEPEQGGQENSTLTIADLPLAMNPEVTVYSGDKFFSGIASRAEGDEMNEEGEEEIVYPKLQDNVEVNLSVDEHKDYLATHLSIHVRSITDVEVFLPLEPEYYIQADDFDIVMQHKKELFVHGGVEENAVLNVGGTDISYIIEFTEDGITFTTDGIDPNAIEFCKEKYEDGITFEAWIYSNIVPGHSTAGTTPIEREELARKLDYSTINFQYPPELYVNAFNCAYDAEGNKIESEKNPFDCIVDPANDYYFGNPIADQPFLNGSNFNVLWYKVYKPAPPVPVY